MFIYYSELAVDIITKKQQYLMNLIGLFLNLILKRIFDYLKNGNCRF